MKTILLSLFLSFNLLGGNSCFDELPNNEAYLYYIESNEEGYFFLEPTHEENIVFIPYNNYDEFYINESQLYKGKKFIGVFDDIYKWELLSIRTVTD